MQTVNIASLVRLSDAERARVEALSPRLRLYDLSGRFNRLIRTTWPAATVARYLPPADPNDAGADSAACREDERDAVLASAEIVLGGFPLPLDLRRRAPQLRWFHQRPAGASNLHPCDLWGSDVTVTTSRGYGDTEAIAEYAIAGLLHFAKGFDHAASDAAAGAFNHTAYRPLRLAGKTLLVIGAGGIGREVAKLAAALGMRVLGTRRSAVSRPEPPFERIDAPDALPALLAASNAVAVCCQWTPETTNLINAAALAALPDDAILINVARGEIIDEDALLAALDTGRLRGAALDVYRGEFDAPPPPRLWSHSRVLLTPHTSSLSDDGRHRALDVFCANLERYLAGQTLQNQVDWERGY